MVTTSSFLLAPNQFDIIIIIITWKKFSTLTHQIQLMLVVVVRFDDLSTYDIDDHVRYYSSRVYAKSSIIRTEGNLA